LVSTAPPRRSTFAFGGLDGFSYIGNYKQRAGPLGIRGSGTPNKAQLRQPTADLNRQFRMANRSTAGWSFRSHRHEAAINQPNTSNQYIKYIGLCGPDNDRPLPARQNTSYKLVASFRGPWETLPMNFPRCRRISGPLESPAAIQLRAEFPERVLTGPLWG